MFMQDFTRFAPATAVTAAEVLLAPVTSGLIAGTLVETAAGWQPVETLRMGMQVQSLDGGLAKVLGLDRRLLRPEVEQVLVRVPGGAFDACSDLLLLPGQHVLIDTLEDARLSDDIFALIPAMALLGAQGVSRHLARAAIEVITPLFAEEEVIYANSGVLLHCPGIAEGAGSRPDAGFFPRLDLAAARAFLLRRAGRLAA